MGAEPKAQAIADAELAITALTSEAANADSARNAA